MSLTISVLIDVIYHPAVKKKNCLPRDLPVNAYAEICFYRSQDQGKVTFYLEKCYLKCKEILTVRIRTELYSVMLTAFCLAQ